VRMFNRNSNVTRRGVDSSPRFFGFLGGEGEVGKGRKEKNCTSHCGRTCVPRDFTRVFDPLRTWQLPAKFDHVSYRIQIDSLPIALASRSCQDMIVRVSPST
jgi:hypothetical protein